MVGEEADCIEGRSEVDSLRLGRIDRYLATENRKPGGWIKPLDYIPEEQQPKKKNMAGRKPKRPIKIRGVAYESVNACKKATGFTVYRIYKLLGEA